MVHGISWHPCRSTLISKTDISCSWRNGFFCGIQQGTDVSQVISTAHWSVMCQCKTWWETYLQGGRDSHQCTCFASSAYKQGVSKQVLLPLFLRGREHIFTTLTVFSKGGTLHSSVSHHENCFPHQNYPRNSSSFSGNCYTVMVLRRWIYSP